MLSKRTCAVATGLLFAVSVSARDEDYVETEAFSKTVSVTFGGASATVNNLAGPGVTYTQSGSVLVFSNTLKQVAFTLAGTTSSGSVKIYSDHAFKLILNSISITSPNGPAINVQSKKVCYVVLPAGTASALTDYSTYATQYDATNGVEDAKGVLFSEGQLVFSGTGVLSVNGVCTEKHGLCSDDYVRIIDGDIRVSMTKKKSDGVHVNDRFRMDGGKLAIALALKGDGIDADDDGSIAINGGAISVSLASSESKGIKCNTNAFEVAGGAINISSSAGSCNGLSANGVVTLDGGLVDISMSGTNCNAIESDQAFIVNGGALAVTASGPQSKGIKTDGDAVFNGGTLRFNLSGDVVLETVTNASSAVYKDPSCSEAVKASNVVVNAGIFWVLTTGVAGRGFSAENDLTVNGGTFAIASSGHATATFTNKQSAADVAAAACMKADRKLTINGGSFTFSVSGTGGKGFAADTALLIAGGTADLDLTGAPAFVDHGTYKEPSYCAGVKCGGNAVVSNGTFTIRHTGIAGRGLSVDTNLLVAGGSFAITTTGTNTAVYTCGVAVVNGKLTNYIDVGAASAIKVDGDAVIGGGTLNLLSSGCCGKGLNVGGVLTIGTNAIAASPSVTARTTGTQFKIALSTTSTGGGGGGGGGGQPADDTADYSNPKAIKVSGKIFINGGTVIASTVSTGGEGIESKDSIIVNGGSIESICYDDCMNAASNITVNGGTIFCSASNNDGIDSNGTFLFNGGIIASFGTTAPEEGIDNDSNTFTVNGGTFVGCGGATSYPNAGSQYAVVYTGSLSSNTVLRITNTSGSIFAFKMPRTYSGSVALLCSCPSIASSGTYTVYTGATTTGADFHGLYTNSVSSASGGTSKGSKSTVTSSHYYAVP
jgi:hypothetical protein